MENIYTQHVPYFVKLLENLAKGRLRPDQLPFIDNRMRDRPQDIILFFVGGVTYEEARFVAQLNEENKAMRILLGGTTMINSRMYGARFLDARDAIRLAHVLCVFAQVCGPDYHGDQQDALEATKYRFERCVCRQCL